MGIDYELFLDFKQNGPPITPQKLNSPKKRVIYGILGFRGVGIDFWSFFGFQAKGGPLEPHPKITFT